MFPRTDEISTVEWSLRLPSNFNAELRHNMTAIALGWRATWMENGLEKVAFRNGNLIFTGTTATLAAIAIRVPSGLIRIIWFGTDLIVEYKYLLTTTGYVKWYEEPNFENLPNPTFIDCYGELANLLTLRHHNKNYVIRLYPDYPLVVVPQFEYLLLQLAHLRDDPISYRGREREIAEEAERIFSPRTPPTEPPNIETSGNPLEVASIELNWTDCE